MTESDAAYLRPLYPSIGAKVARRMRDLPWRLNQMYDATFQTLFWSEYQHVRPYTMVSYAGLRALHTAIRRALAKGIPGDVVECGVAHGGSAIIMGFALKKFDQSRKLWLFDTFEGIPAPNKNDPDFDLASHYTGQFKGAVAEIKERLLKIDILDRSVLVKGPFQETLVKSEVVRIAVLHLDGDWYDSIKVSLDSLYERVSPGGIIQIDDYGTWAGTRKAVDEFTGRRNLRLRYVDHAIRQIAKPICA
jgi:hypothetical protein